MDGYDNVTLLLVAGIYTNPLRMTRLSCHLMVQVAREKRARL